jgi:hypothetical protein
LKGRFGARDVALAVFFALIGFALGQLRASSAIADVHTQLEDVKEKASRSDENLVNFQARANLGDSYRHSLSALVALLDGREGDARNQLTTASRLIGGSKDPLIHSLAESAASLATAPALKSKQTDLRSLLIKFQQMTPQAIGDTGGSPGR